MENNSQILVSIVMPAFQAAEIISSSISSIISQTYKNWELIIVDDCSKDETCEIVEAWSKEDKRIRLEK